MVTVTSMGGGVWGDLHFLPVFFYTVHLFISFTTSMTYFDLRAYLKQCHNDTENAVTCMSPRGLEGILCSL